MASAFTPAVEESVRLQVDRILHSECFRGAESMRNLLAYLASKMLAGDADQLKEYSIGVDAFGKPPSYDPRSDSTVRVQTGRLRQKLAEYYRTEGALDTVIVDLPKGQLTLAYRLLESPVIADRRDDLKEAEAPVDWRHRARIAAGIAVVAMALVAVLGVALWRVRPQSKVETPWTAQLEELWASGSAPWKVW